VEIQAGLFRNQETYGFLEPQESRAFTEYWIPIRGLGGVARANPDAVLNLTRQTADGGVIALEAILNVTQELPNASVSIQDGTRTVASAHESLSPRGTFHTTFPGLPANATYTVELRNAAGQIVL
jgi:hypothetical protein